MIQVNRTVFIAGPKKISIKFVTVVELHFLGAFARMGETIQSLAGVTTRACRDCIWNIPSWIHSYQKRAWDFCGPPLPCRLP